MFKHELKKIILLTTISFAPAFAGNDGLLGNLLGVPSNSVASQLMSSGFGSSINVTEMVGAGNMPLEVECEPDVDMNFGNLSDICSTYRNTESKANGLLGKMSKGFSFNGCSIANSDRNTCRNDALRKLCSNLSNPNGKTLFGTGTSNIKNKENMLYSGGDIYLKGNQCDFNSKSILGEDIKYGNKTNRQVEDSYLSPSTIANKPEAGGQSAYWKPGKLNLYETCIKNSLNNGNKNPEESCKGEFYSLPTDRIAAEEQIATTTKTGLKDSASGLNKKVKSVEKTLKSTSYPACTQVNSNGDCTDPNYVNNVKTKMDEIVKAEEMDRIKKTEEEMATFQEHIKIATMPKYEITYPTQEVLNGLHPDQKAEFVVLANKQMHQKALFNSGIQNITDLKKELIEVSFQKAELSSKTFYPNAALEEAKRIMDNGL